MINEPTPLVRKQLLQSIDSVLEVCPNSYPVIWAWCKIITPMMRDNEVKNIELAMEVRYYLIILIIETKIINELLF